MLYIISICISKRSFRILCIANNELCKSLEKLFSCLTVMLNSLERNYQNNCINYAINI